MSIAMLKDQRIREVALTATTQRARQMGRLLQGTGILWVVIAMLVMGAAFIFPWLYVPYIRTYTAFALPIDFGWGLRSPFISYGLLCALAMATCLVRGVLAFDWQLQWFGASGLLPVRPIRPQTLAKLGVLCLSVFALFLYQWLLVDMQLVSQLVNQENQSLLVRAALDYTTPTQFIPMQALAVSMTSLGARFTLLVQLFQPALLLPLLAGLVCLYGAYLTNRTRQLNLRAALYHVPEQPWSRREIVAATIALSVLGLIFFGHAPLGTIVESMGRQQMLAGDYHDALQSFATAERLNPTLTSSLVFHEERGQALYFIGQRTSLDAGLYLARTYRADGGGTDAWREDELLQGTYKGDPMLAQDSTISLEQLIQGETNNISPAGRPADPIDPLYAANRILPQYAQALPHLSALVALDPGNMYAWYLHGRILFAEQSYDLAARDFQQSIELSHDNDMLSADYTFLAFCRGYTGDYAQERLLLQKAMELDHGYYNTTAREAASGLH